MDQWRIKAQNLQLPLYVPIPKSKIVLLPGGKLPGTPNQEARWVWVQNVSSLAYCDYKIEKTRHFFPLPLDARKLKGVQLQGASPPDPRPGPWTPGPRWGLCPQTPVIGSRSTRSPCAPQRQFLDPPLKGRENLAPTVISKSRRLCWEPFMSSNQHATI